MPDRFETIIRFTLHEEGGYVDHPNDPGGETNFGISKRQYPHLDIKNLTAADAAALYRRDYWQPFRCGDFPPGLDFAMFDAGVQHRPDDAVKLVQRALNVKADGAIGPVTLGTAHRALAIAALNRYFSYRAGFYADLIAADQRRAVFRDGWFARLFRLQAYIIRTTPMRLEVY